MMRIGAAAIGIGLAGAVLLSASGASAQTTRAGMQLAQATVPVEPPVYRRRPPRQIPIYPRYRAEPDGVYPRYFPGSNAVRDCDATYVQEHRPSGTVIVPRMKCFWRPG